MKQILLGSLLTILIISISIFGYKYFFEESRSTTNRIEEFKTTTPVENNSQTVPDTTQNNTKPSSKEAVYLQHDGSMVYCEVGGVSAVKEASSMIVKIQEEIAKCDTVHRSSLIQCTDSCENRVKELVPSCYGDQQCLEAIQSGASRCLSDCRTAYDDKNRWNCPAAVNQNRYDTLNKLIDTYCN